MTETSRPKGLEQLTTLAERLACKLVADGEMPDGVLLVERAGELHVEMLEGTIHRLALTARALVARHAATSAALIVWDVDPPGGSSVRGLYIHGEDVDGTTVDRRYRVHVYGRRGHLSALRGDDATRVMAGLRTLFPLRVAPTATSTTPCPSSSTLDWTRADSPAREAELVRRVPAVASGGERLAGGDDLPPVRL